LRIEQNCSTIVKMRGREFLRRWSAERGVGTVYLGKRRTVVKDLKKELGPGLLAGMCKQLGIRKEDL
jgi:hypothetical protein